MKTASKSAFTIIELSVVIFVISLIAAGITLTSRLISSAQTRALIRDVGYYKSAIDNFKIIYGAFPGDFDNAYNLWGSLPGVTCSDNIISQIKSDGCNGNGNQIIESNYTEDMLSWKHLVLSGFIPGSYQGTALLVASTPTAGANIPFGAIENSVYYLSYFTVYNRSGNGFSLIDATTITIGANGVTSNGVTSPTIAYYIDSKIDDGLSYKGNIYTNVAPNYSLKPQSCATNSSITTTNGYYLLDNNASCLMWFYL